MKTAVCHLTWLCIAFFFFLTGCSEDSSYSNTKPLVTAEAVKPFLRDTPTRQLLALEANIAFFQARLRQSPASPLEMSSLASAYQGRFRKLGYINDLLIADSLLVVAAKQPGSSRQYGLLRLRAASQSARHHFTVADSLLRINLAEGDEMPGASRLLLADVLLEQGHYVAAMKQIAGVMPQDVYDVWVRKAKYYDTAGQTDSSLFYLERGYTEVNQNPGMQNARAWIAASLADAYSHNGKLELAVTRYLEALKADSCDYRALRMLTRIALRVDKNPTLAETLLTYIAAHNAMPDIWLDQAEVAAAQGNNIRADSLTRAFVAEATKPKYGNMFVTYLVDLYTDDLGRAAEAISLAQADIHHRPSPFTYHYLAWSHYQAGDTARARAILRERVAGHTHEPLALLRIGLMTAPVDKKLAQSYLTKAAEGSYELGPEHMARIAVALK